MHVYCTDHKSRTGVLDAPHVRRLTYEGAAAVKYGMGSKQHEANSAARKMGGKSSTGLHTDEDGFATDRPLGP